MEAITTTPYDTYLLSLKEIESFEFPLNSGLGSTTIGEAMSILPGMEDIFVFSTKQTNHIPILVVATSADGEWCVCSKYDGTLVKTNLRTHGRSSRQTLRWKFSDWERPNPEWLAAILKELAETDEYKKRSAASDAIDGNHIRPLDGRQDQSVAQNLQPGDHLHETEVEQPNHPAMESTSPCNNNPPMSQKLRPRNRRSKPNVLPINDLSARNTRSTNRTRPMGQHSTVDSRVPKAIRGIRGGPINKSTPSSLSPAQRLEPTRIQLKSATLDGTTHTEPASEAKHLQQHNLREGLSSASEVITAGEQTPSSLSKIIHVKTPTKCTIGQNEESSSYVSEDLDYLFLDKSSGSSPPCPQIPSTRKHPRSPSFTSDTEDDMPIARTQAWRAIQQAKKHQRHEPGRTDSGDEEITVVQPSEVIRSASPHIPVAVMTLPSSKEGANKMTGTRGSLKNTPISPVLDAGNSSSSVAPSSDDTKSDPVATSETKDHVPEEEFEEPTPTPTKARMLRAADYAPVRDKDGELWLVPVADHPAFSSSTKPLSAREQLSKEQYRKGDAILRGTLPSEVITKADLEFLERQADLLDCQIEKRQQMKERIETVVREIRVQKHWIDGGKRSSGVSRRLLCLYGNGDGDGDLAGGGRGTGSLLKNQYHYEPKA
ncbi:hypothetical protein K491DRAFT_682420 [Lophiostoma macrostomum CBS 122681]|uniref:Uncharacterized protein n=1 Tax=Lophiostoma macrostomum CBS 122681 TaxID=1314788 RepID=A0A6A6STU6_9PLEO|nr:hypothetical protein K491DRAFT_682420 [Lophiostoma macrostomum CBS 122681]